MEEILNIAVRPEHDDRGNADLYLPEIPAGAPAALVIHGGGWCAMEKRSLKPVALEMVKNGYAAFNTNYRLVTEAPWPACGNDCIASGEFLLANGHEAMEQLDTDRIVIIGASAGGHLALWTAAHLPTERVRAVISIAGPSDLVRRLRNLEKLEKVWTTFLGGPVTEEKMAAASPVNYVRKGMAPLLCIQSINDELVRPEQSEAMVDAWQRAGNRAELFTFSGPGDAHGIWEDGSGEVDTDERVLVPEVKQAIADFLETV